MRETLDTLKDYQEVLLRIEELNRLLSFIPPETLKLKEEWESAQKTLTELSTKKEELETKIKALDVKLTDAKASADKYDHDLKQVTNDKEYRAVMKEIDTAKKTINLLQEEMSTFKSELAAVEEKTAELTTLESDLSGKHDASMAELKEKQQESHTELDERSKEKEKLGGQIPVKLKRQFERIASRRNGVGLAMCVSAVCQSCNVRVRQNVVDQLRKFDRLITCESCKRMLYFYDQE